DVQVEDDCATSRFSLLRAWPREKVLVSEELTAYLRTLNVLFNNSACNFDACVMPEANIAFQQQTQKEEQPKPVPMAVADILSTEKGTTFYVLTVAGDMRLNFLNYLESWCEQAKERAASVVVAKSEELNSELDLRLHLHQPRSRRAELDVHNVRAAELVMHAERVTRHCKGIGQSLTELRSRFTAMSSHHNKLAQKFRQDIEALEVIFINATKSSRLVALQNQLGVELEKYMSVIRTSLRQFRQHLDETLQMLRESNARFIKSFKLFSDGGNFCPEEIEEYRRRLEKMSNKINTAEGSIMSELEGMESKRLDVATKVSNEFEDRFKSHMFDLLFMEKVARWLTNTQVKIKAEVAASNSQAQALARHLLDLERRIDACEKPNFDKEQITPTQLNDFLTTVMESFHQRSEYLNCAKNLARPSSAMQAGIGSASKTGVTTDAMTPVSRPGKQPSEDPSVNVIKNILRTQKAKMQFGTEATLDVDFSQAGGMPPPSAFTGADASREKTKSAMSQASTKIIGSEKAATGRRPTLPSIPPTSELSTPLAGLKRNTSARIPVMAFLLQTTFEQTGDRKDKSKTTLFNEGEESVEEEKNHFMGSIQRTLREATDGLLTTAEAYYKQKGTRLVTRPQVLQETFEQYQEVINQKILSYLQQCEDYHNQCLQEFRQQLTKVEQLAALVPTLVINDLVNKHIQNAKSAHTKMQEEFQKTLDEINARQTCAVEHAKTLLDALPRLAEQQLVQYDGLLVVDDVEKGRVERTRYPTSELIRRKEVGEPLIDEDDRDALPRGKGNWLGMPLNQLVAENRPSKLQLTPTVQTSKTTLGHSSTVKARDSAYEDYKVQFENTLAMIEEEKERLVRDEEHWTNSWLTSVQRVKDLHQPQ
ncbi:hypothetical protein BaRGS_00012951, partial [Batillaria attramentaria]